VTAKAGHLTQGKDVLLFRGLLLAAPGQPAAPGQLTAPGQSADDLKPVPDTVTEEPTEPVVGFNQIRAGAAAWAGWIPATAILAITISAIATDLSVRNKAISPQIDGWPEPQKVSASSTGSGPKCKSRSLPKKAALLFSNRLRGREQT
jgi:hypothetical protein